MTTTSPSPTSAAELVAVASTLVVDALAHGVSGLPEPQPQRGDVTLAEKITKEDLHLDWSEPAVQLKRVVRLGKAWSTFRGKRLTVLEARLGDGRPAVEHRPVGWTDRSSRRGAGHWNSFWSSPRAVLPCQPRSGCAVCGP